MNSFIKRTVFVITILFFNSLLTYSTQEPNNNQNNSINTNNSTQRTIKKKKKKRKQQELTENQRKSNIYKRIKKANEMLNQYLRSAIHPEIKDLLFKARRHLRLSALSYRRNKKEQSIKLYNIAKKYLDEIPLKIEKYKKQLIEARMAIGKARQEYAALLKKSPNGEAYSLLNKSKYYIRYADVFLSKQKYIKALKLANKAQKLLKEANKKHNENLIQIQQNQRISIKASNLLSKCRSILWKVNRIIVPGEIRKNYLKAKGLFISAEALINRKKYKKGIDKLNKSIEILNKIPDSRKEYDENKLKAYKELEKVNKQFKTVSRKRLVGEDLSNFIKAKKILFRARYLYSTGFFKQSIKLAGQSFEILKNL